MNERDSERRVCAVLDANQWRCQLLLRSNLGAALLHILDEMNGSMGLPEVIELEVRKHIVKAGKEAGKRVKDGLSTIRSIIGAWADVKIPSDGDFATAVDTRFHELSKFLVKVPFTESHARAALAMVIDEVPPNGQKNQQFKDSAIWQALLELSQESDVVFVTNDSGFFQGGDVKNKVLAENLAADCSTLGRRITIFDELGSCLEALRKEAPQLDKAQLIAVVVDHLHSQLWSDAGKYGLFPA